MARVVAVFLQVVGRVRLHHVRECLPVQQGLVWKECFAIAWQTADTPASVQRLMVHRWRVRCSLWLPRNTKLRGKLSQLRFAHARNEDLLDLVKRSIGGFRSDLLTEPPCDGVGRLTG